MDDTGPPPPLQRSPQGEPAVGVAPPLSAVQLETPASAEDHRPWWRKVLDASGVLLAP